MLKNLNIFFAMMFITMIELAALQQGINGVLLRIAIVVIAVLGGYTIRITRKGNEP